MSTINDSKKTLNDMVNTVFFMVSEKRGSSIFGENDVITAINMGLNHVWKAYNHFPTLGKSTTETGTRLYLIPDAQQQQGQVIVDRVYVEGNEITPADFSPEGTSSGKPTEYFINGANIYFNPTPDGAYAFSVLYRLEHPYLSGLTLTSNLPDLGVDAAQMYACYMLKLKDEEYTSADRFKAEYEDLLKLLNSSQAGVYKAGDATAEFKYRGGV